MTRITVCGYTIAADGNNWTLYEHRRKGEEAKNPDEPYEVAVGYFSRLPHALDALLDRKLRESDARSLKELAAELAVLRSEIMGVFALAGA
jgi:hypothetical protein